MAKPKYIEEAIDKIKWYQHTTKAIFGKTVRKREFFSDSDNDETHTAVNTVKSALVNRKPQFVTENYSIKSMEALIEILIDNVQLLQTKVLDMEKAKQRTGENIGQQRQRPWERRTCYNWNQPGHFIKDLQDCLHIVSQNLKVRLKTAGCWPSFKRERVRVEGGTQTRYISERLHNKQHDPQPKAAKQTTRKRKKNRGKRTKKTPVDENNNDHGTDQDSCNVQPPRAEDDKDKTITIKQLVVISMLRVELQVNKTKVMAVADTAAEVAIIWQTTSRCRVSPKQNDIPWCMAQEEIWRWKHSSLDQ